MSIEFWIYILVGVQFGGMIFYNLYIRYIRPIISYKLVVFDTDDEFTFIRKKGKAKVYGDYKGYLLFKEKTELYSIPLQKEEDKKVSKRDNNGMVTYYYHRNNTQPLYIDDIIRNVNKPKDITNNEKISINKQAKVLSSVMKTKIIDSSLLGEHKAPVSTTLLFIIMGILIVVILFKDEIMKMFGG